MDRERAVFLLAQKLYETMERLDPPTADDEQVTAWSEMEDLSREFYVSCIESLLVERDQILTALSDDHMIIGGAEGAE